MYVVGFAETVVELLAVSLWGSVGNLLSVFATTRLMCFFVLPLRVQMPWWQIKPMIFELLALSRSYFFWASQLQAWNGRPRSELAPIWNEQHLIYSELVTHFVWVLRPRSIFLLVVLVTAIFNFFIGTFIPVKAKESLGFFGYDGETKFLFLFSPPVR